MNATTAAREATRSPSVAARHADDVACHAAHQARKAGADVSQCVEAYAKAYAAAMAQA